MRAALQSALVVLLGGIPVAHAGTDAEASQAAARQLDVTSEGERVGNLLGIEMKVKHFTLSNGLRVFVHEDHSTPMFAFHMAFDVGSRDEDTGRSGFAHFFEHMMFKGSENVPEGGHFKYILGAGGELNAFTTADSTQYFDIVPANYLERVLFLEADRVKSLAVTPANFENQRQAILEEMALRVDNVPYARSLREFFAEIWSGTGYGHMTIGSKADLNAATTKDVKAFFDRHYVPNNGVIAIVGDVDYADVKAKVDQYFGDIPKGPDPTPRPAVDHSQGEPLEKRVTDRLAQQPLYLVGWKTTPRNHEDRHAIDILMNVLLRGESSRITRLLKDDKRLVVASVPLPADAAGGEAAGSAVGAFVPAPGKTIADIKPVIMSEVASVKSRGITSKELQKAVNQLTVDTVSGLSTNAGRARRIAEGVLFNDDPTFVFSDLDQYRKVTTADIKRVANNYLTENWLVLEILPPKK
ncbi:MAG: pitrilysin family protein [Myxococcota bacterium]